MSITQELLHSIKVKKQKVMVLKLDLVKAFDHVDWTFLRLVLLQIGVPVEGVNWIMGCVSSPNFAVLINGTPQKKFYLEGYQTGIPPLPTPLHFGY